MSTPHASTAAPHSQPIVVIPPGTALDVADSGAELRWTAAMEALAPNTRRAYLSAWSPWRRWAGLNGVHELEPNPGQLRAYLQARHRSGASLSSLGQTIAAIRKIQELMQLRETAKDRLVADTLSGIARDCSGPRHQATALTGEALAMIELTACRPRPQRAGRVESGGGATRRGRRSEAGALVWADVERWDDGSCRLTVRRSTAASEAQAVYLTPATLAAVEAIRPAAADDPIFDLASAGAPTHEIMGQGRWKSTQMVSIYTRAEEAGRAARWLN